MTRRYNKSRSHRNKKSQKNKQKRTKNKLKRTKNKQKGGLFSWQRRCFSDNICSKGQKCKYKSGFLNISYGFGRPGYHCVSEKNWF